MVDVVKVLDCTLRDGGYVNNWNFSQFLEQSRMQFLKQSHTQLLVETVQGRGPHLEALAKLMTCPQSSTEAFSNLFADLLKASKIINS